MKRAQLILLCVVLLLHIRISAQEPLPGLTEKKPPKPYLFTSLPDQFEVSLPQLQQILSANVNEKVSAQLSGQIQITGIVVDKSQHTPGSLTSNIRIENYHNALLNLTIRFLADNSTSIQGRIIHPKYGDVLEIFKQNDRYFIRKISQRLFMPE